MQMKYNYHKRRMETQEYVTEIMHIAFDNKGDHEKVYQSLLANLVKTGFSLSREKLNSERLSSVCMKTSLKSVGKQKRR
jgi:hypothetical protein